MPERSSTKDRIVEAALRTLKEEGFSGASARAIARRGDFNQALIFYHFGTLGDLLLAALDRTAAERMARYMEAVGAASTVEEKLNAARELYRDDLASGHITVISEMVAASLARPDLASEVVARMEPWIQFVENLFAEVLAGTPLQDIIPPRATAFGVVALYLGVDLLSHLEHDQSKAEALFDTVGRLLELFRPMLGAPKAPVSRPRSAR